MAWVLLGISRPAQASVLYRCTGPQAEVVFTGSKAGYRACRQVASLPTAPMSAGLPRPSKQIRSLARVTGTAHTTATPLVPAVVALARVAGAARTTARATPATLAGRPGQWTYSEPSYGGPAIMAQQSAYGSANDRVLRGNVYRVTHRDGSVEYTNIPPDGSKVSRVTRLFSYIATCMACNLRSTIDWSTVALNLDAYQGAIHEASRESGVDEALLRAIIHAESAFNPRAMSLKGAQGLMQLMPSTANDMGVLDAFDPAQNIRGGARYLGLLMKYFNGDVRLAAAAYNAGPYAVEHYNGVPPFVETQVYVRRVGELLKRYGKALHPPLASL